MTESTNTAAAINAARKIAVVGSGYMGGGIAQVLALGGARVALADVSAEVGPAPINGAPPGQARLHGIW